MKPKVRDRITYRRTTSVCQGCPQRRSRSGRKADGDQNLAIRHWAKEHCAETGHDVMISVVEDIVLTRDGES